jgi:hypothetical protein
MNFWSHGHHRLPWTASELGSFVRGFVLVNIIFFGVYSVQNIYHTADYVHPPEPAYIPDPAPNKKPDTALEEYLFIFTRRNIFGHGELTTLQGDNTLPLRLVGTVRSREDHIAGNCMVILEDLRTSEQGVFDTGDMVFKIGHVDNIGLDYVDIVTGLSRYRLFLEKEVTAQQKKVQDIEIEIASNLDKQDSEVTGITEVSFRNYEIKKSVVQEIMGNLPEHLQTGHSKLHSDGILIYGLPRSSIFRQIGIVNSDIITHINGKPVTSVLGAKEMYDTFVAGGINSVGSVQVIVKRAGLSIPLNYTIVD